MKEFYTLRLLAVKIDESSIINGCFIMGTSFINIFKDKIAFIYGESFYIV